MKLEKQTPFFDVWRTYVIAPFEVDDEDDDDAHDADDVAKDLLCLYSYLYQQCSVFTVFVWICSRVCLCASSWGLQSLASEFYYHTARRLLTEFQLIFHANPKKNASYHLALVNPAL